MLRRFMGLQGIHFVWGAARHRDRPTTAGLCVFDTRCVFVCSITPMKSTELIKHIKADGWYLVHVVGSHHQFKHPLKPGKVTVPHPKKDLPLPTVRSILKQAGL